MRDNLCVFSLSIGARNAGRGFNVIYCWITLIVGDVCGEIFAKIDFIRYVQLWDLKTPKQDKCNSSGTGALTTFKTLSWCSFLTAKICLSTVKVNLLKTLFAPRPRHQYCENYANVRFSVNKRMKTFNFYRR